MTKKVVPEFEVKRDLPRRAGFIPNGDWRESEVELWQLWCRDAEGEVARRATVDDLRSAGFVRKDGKRKTTGRK